MDAQRPENCAQWARDSPHSNYEKEKPRDYSAGATPTSTIKCSQEATLRPGPDTCTVSHAGSRVLNLPTFHAFRLHLERH